LNWTVADAPKDSHQFLLKLLIFYFSSSYVFVEKVRRLAYMLKLFETVAILDPP